MSPKNILNTVIISKPSSTEEEEEEEEDEKKGGDEPANQGGVENEALTANWQVEHDVKAKGEGENGKGEDRKEESERPQNSEVHAGKGSFFIILKPAEKGGLVLTRSQEESACGDGRKRKKEREGFSEALTAFIQAAATA